MIVLEKVSSINRNNFLVTQQRYEMDIFRESVISGNDALFKCSIPSFVSDLVSVQSWIDSEGGVTAFGSFGNSCFPVMFSFKALTVEIFSNAISWKRSQFRY